MIIVVLLYCTGRPICRNNEHVVGSWVKDNVTQKSYYCCGYDKLDHRHNISACGGITLAGLPSHWGWNDLRSQSGGHACACDKSEGRTSVNPREMYVWRPANCQLLLWQAKQFCNLLDNRTVLFLGDSTMQQSAHSLMSMIYTGNGGCANRIAVTKSRLYLYQDVAMSLSIYTPSILVLNHGAHAQDDMDIKNALKEMLRQVMIHNQKTGNSTRVIWRTNAPGHVNCTSYASPSIFRWYDPVDDYYRWSLFPQWDEIARNFSHEHGWNVADISPLYQRHDAHPGEGDCLHYCMPGPVDLLSILLLQKMYLKEI